MYTQEDVRKLFKQRGEIEMELRVRQAQYYGREAETPIKAASRLHNKRLNLPLPFSSSTVISFHRANVLSFM